VTISLLVAAAVIFLAMAMITGLAMRRHSAASMEHREVPHLTPLPGPTQGDHVLTSTPERGQCRERTQLGRLRSVVY
jgi:hypothetical protein